MRKNKSVQILVSEAEYALIAEAAERSGSNVCRKGRDVLLAWAKQALDVPGGARGGRCGSTRGCPNRNATWWNGHSKIFQCEACAKSVNGNNDFICIEGAGPPRLSDEVIAGFWKEVQASSETFASELARAIARNDVSTALDSLKKIIDKARETAALEEAAAKRRPQA